MPDIAIVGSGPAGYYTAEAALKTWGEAARIDVPLLLALGERDIAGPTHQVPAAFTASRDICLHILPETGHSHFLFPARTGLFNRLGGWARQVL